MCGSIGVTYAGARECTGCYEPSRSRIEGGVMIRSSDCRVVIGMVVLALGLASGEAAACTYSVAVPGASDVWHTGSAASIRWTKSGSCSDRVDIDLLRDGQWVMTIASNQLNNGSATWMVPSSLRSALDYQVRVRDRDDDSFGLSREFIIANSAYCGYRITQPAEGDTWYLGTSHTVRWNRAGTCPSPVGLHLLRGDIEVAVIAEETGDDGAFTWTVPSDSQPGGDFAIRIHDTDDWNSYDVSDAFTIADEPSCAYQVDEPTAASTWRMGETHDIQWSSSDGCEGNVDLDLLRAGGTVASIAAGTEDDGSLPWTIPGDLEAADDYQVRVAAAADPGRYDVSPQFRIEAAVEPPEDQVYWVEIASHQAGQAGSIWRTDLVARNLSEAEADVEIRLRGAGGGTLTTVIAGGSQAVFEDVLGLMGVEGTGWLEITSTRPLMVSGRIYNLGEDGTFGQYLEGYPEGGGLPVGVVGTLLQLRQLEGEFRTNIGFTNPSSTDGAVQVTLFDAGGTELIRYRVDLDPRALVQDLEPYSRRASRPDLGWGFAEVEVLEGGPVL
ncbi:MAG: hypothetical protein EHM57_03525, partial [Actinobacteria bacterium]